MPRRDELSEEKRKRLMQEHEQLQKLMLQARSSVRRSSMKETQEVTEMPSDTYPSLTENSETRDAQTTPVDQQKEQSTPEKKLLTEKDLFPTETIVNTAQQEHQPLTERELFKETNGATATQPLQKSNTVNVILPNQITTAPVVQPKVEHTETIAAPPEVVEEDTPQEAPEIQDENTYAYNDEIQQSKRSKTRTVVLLLIAVLLAGIGGYYFYVVNQKHNTTAAIHHSVPSQVATISTTRSQPDTTQANTNNEKTAAKTQNPQKPLSEELKNFDNVTVVKTPATSKTQTAQSHENKEPQTTPNESLGKYKVISKAYFHNQPDESTRRKSFMTHWDNAVLTPLEERNDFIYIVFTNHLGQTSKGWLRKSDLKRIE